MYFDNFQFGNPISAGYVRVFASPFNIMLIEAINLKPIFIKYIVFSGIEVVNSSIEYYFDCGNAENVLSTEAPHIANTASTHMHAIAFTVVFVQLLIMRIRWKRVREREWERDDCVMDELVWVCFHLFWLNKIYEIRTSLCLDYLSSVCACVFPPRATQTDKPRQCVYSLLDIVAHKSIKMNFRINCGVDKCWRLSVRISLAVVSVRKCWIKSPYTIWLCFFGVCRVEIVTKV